MIKHESIEKSIHSQPEAVRELLWSIKETIEKTVPQAVGGIAYGMPAYKFNKKPLIYFNGFKNHIGIYPTPGVIEKFKSRLSAYKVSKGAVQLPYSEELPLKLIAEMVKYRSEIIETK